jgi:hypothetical protein
MAFAAVDAAVIDAATLARFEDGLRNVCAEQVVRAGLDSVELLRVRFTSSQVEV